MYGLVCYIFNPIIDTIPTFYNKKKYMKNIDNLVEYCIIIGVFAILCSEYHNLG